MDEILGERFLKLVGYALRGTARRCSVVLRGGDSWLLDLEARPLRIMPQSAPEASVELELEFTPEDADTIASNVALRTVEQWVESGRIRIRGDEGAVRRVRAWIAAGGAAIGLYAELAERIRDPRFVFMNHGFVDPGVPEDFSWLRPEDKPWRYSMNLVRHVTSGVELAGKRILDVGCGRGGACSYYARYHAPEQIVGLDISPDNIAFCADTYRLENLRFDQGDAQQLPFEDASVDVVTNIESSHCYPRLPAFFAEVRRVLRPGGVFCYTDNLNRTDVPQREHQLREAGGEIVASREIVDGVIEALARCSESFTALMADIARDHPSDASFITQFGEHVLAASALYRSGGRTYWSYRVAFPTI